MCIPLYMLYLFFTQCLPKKIHTTMCLHKKNIEQMREMNSQKDKNNTL